MVLGRVLQIYLYSTCIVDTPLTKTFKHCGSSSVFIIFIILGSFSVMTTENSCILFVPIPIVVFPKSWHGYYNLNAQTVAPVHSRSRTKHCIVYLIQLFLGTGLHTHHSLHITKQIHIWP